MFYHSELIKNKPLLSLLMSDVSWSYIENSSSWTLFLHFNEDGLYDAVVDIKTSWGVRQIDDMSKLPQLEQVVQKYLGSEQDDVSLQDFVDAADMRGRSLEVSSNPTTVAITFKAKMK